MAEIAELSGYLINGQAIKFYHNLWRWRATNENADAVRAFVKHLYEYMEKDNPKIRKDIVILCLLASHNRELLNALENYEKHLFTLDISKPLSIYNYGVFKSRLWIYELLYEPTLYLHGNEQRQSDSIYHKLLLIKLIVAVNNVCNATGNVNTVQALSADINVSHFADYWQRYKQTIDNACRIIEFIRRTYPKPEYRDDEMFIYACTQDVLATLSQFCDLMQKSKWSTISNELKSGSIVTESEDTLYLFDAFVILLTFLQYLSGFGISLPRPKTLIELPAGQLQLHVMQCLWNMLFAKSLVHGNYVCKQAQCAAILSFLSTVISGVKNRYKSGEHRDEFLNIQKIVLDALYRLALIGEIVNHSELIDSPKYLSYFVSKPESLTYLCMKNDNYGRALDVVGTYKLTDTAISHDVAYAIELSDLKRRLRESENTLELVLQFLEMHKNRFNDDAIFDMIVTQPLSVKQRNALLNFISKTYDPEKDRDLYRFLTLIQTDMQTTADRDNVSICDVIVGSSAWNLKDIANEDAYFVELQSLYEKFCLATKQNTGSSPLDHPAQKILYDIANVCLNYQIVTINQTTAYMDYVNDLGKYVESFLEWLHNLNALNVVQSDEYGSHFGLLLMNRSELLGKLVFEYHKHPEDFEPFFKKMNLDLIYHLVGNSFPTINLHVQPHVTIDELYQDNRNLYTPHSLPYIDHYNWLLAYILSQIHNIPYRPSARGEVEKRLAPLTRFLNSEQIQQFKIAYGNNAVMTALQGCICVQDIAKKIEERFNDVSRIEHGESSHQLSVARGVTSWSDLLGMLNSIREREIKLKPKLVHCRDQILCGYIVETYDYETINLIHLIRDDKMRLACILNVFKKIVDVGVVATTLRHEVSRDTDYEATERDKLKKWLLGIELCESVSGALPVPFRECNCWYSKYEYISDNKELIIMDLLNSDHIGTAIQVIQVFDMEPNSVSELINTNVFLKALEMDLVEEALQLLYRLPEAQQRPMAQSVMDQLRNLNHIKLFHKFLNELPGTSRDIKLMRAQVSLDIIGLFDDIEQSQFVPLLYKPIQIIEMLLMNLLLDKLRSAMAIVKSYADLELLGLNHIEQLIQIYALKSLHILHLPVRSDSPDLHMCQSVNRGLYGLVCSTTPSRLMLKKDWVPNDIAIKCMCCKIVVFTMFTRRHHCRRCGRVVCCSCSRKRMQLVHEYGHVLVRVCTSCCNNARTAQLRSSQESCSTYPKIELKTTNEWVFEAEPSGSEKLRQEFYYHHAPSLHIFMSLMSFITPGPNYANFLVSQCQRLLNYLIDQDAPAHPYIDYTLIGDILKALVTVANISSVHSHCDLMEEQTMLITKRNLDIVSRLINDLSLHRVPPMALRSMDFCDIRNSLIKAERWDVAISVSLRGNLHWKTVYGAWGHSCLAAGNFQLARDKFDKYGFQHHSPFLHDIIKLLENEGRKVTLRTSETAYDLPDVILTRILNAEKLSDRATIPFEEDSAVITKRRNPINEAYYKECIHYLQTYASYTELMEFYIKHKDFKMALHHVQESSKRHARFCDMYMMCLKKCYTKEIQSHIALRDTSLAMWKDDLLKLGCHLEENKLFNSLLDLQVFMGDFLRAAMSCIRFYQQCTDSFTCFVRSNKYLEEAKKYLKALLEQDEWLDVVTRGEDNTDFDIIFARPLFNSDITLRTTRKTIKYYIKLIECQKKEAQCLASWEERNDSENQEETAVVNAAEVVHKMRGPETVKHPLPTLLHTVHDRCLFAAVYIVCHPDVEAGFSKANELAAILNLERVTIYRIAGNYMATNAMYERLKRVTTMIRSPNNTPAICEMWDQVLHLAARSMVASCLDSESIHRIVQLIDDKNTRVTAYLDAKHVKSAYLISVQYNLIGGVRRTLEVAKSIRNTALVDLCMEVIRRYEQRGSIKASDDSTRT